MAKLTASNQREALARGELVMSNLNGVISIAVIDKQDPSSTERVLFRMYLSEGEARDLSSFLYRILSKDSAH